MRLAQIIGLACTTLPWTSGQDDIGFGNGIVDLETKHWSAKFIKESGTLASLKPAGSDFDFLPFDLLQLGRRLQNGCYHWGDVNIRYRNASAKDWTDSSSAAERAPVNLLNSSKSFMLSDLSPTMPTGPLNISREWIDVSGDLGLRFTIENTGNEEIEIGSLGFAAAVNNIFTSRNASNMNTVCSLMDPYIGLDAGYLRVTPLSGIGAALVVTPLQNTPFEAYRYLPEESRGETKIGTNAWEGFFEWQVHSKAWATQEWKNTEPWNSPSSVTLQPGQQRQYGVRFSVAEDGIRGIDATIRKTGTPTAIGVPGYIVPRDAEARLFVQSDYDVSSWSIYPQHSLDVVPTGNKTYTISPSPSSWGRVRLTLGYANNVSQSIHYYITKAGPEAVADLGRFLSTHQWFDGHYDPFGRSPSIMGYDREAGSIVEQDNRLQTPGLSDEGGAGAYVAAAIKQTFQPNLDEISKLETFVDEVLSTNVQNEGNAVKRGLFFYDPGLVPDYNYSSDINWDSASGRDTAYEINRAYNYVWPAACYWALYRVGRALPKALSAHDAEWYLDQAFRTVMRGMEPDVQFNDKGLMGETVFGHILVDLSKEGKVTEAEDLKAAMKARVDMWLGEEYPYGSEQSWDSTGQEGIYYWARYFGETEMAEKVKNSVLGYMPTAPHWGYNGNARRYWDFVVAGKLRVVERQIHHYGSGLNALVMLSAFRDDPSDAYLLRVGYGGTSGPLSNIHEDGFASCAMHAWPEHLAWDSYSGDYGPNFVGMALGSGTYLVDDPDVGVVAYGGILNIDGSLAVVKVRDSVRQKVYIGQLGTEIKIDAGIIEDFTYNLQTRHITLTLSRLENAPKPEDTVIWVSTNGRPGEEFEVTAAEGHAQQERQGTKVHYTSDHVVVHVRALEKV